MTLEFDFANADFEARAISPFQEMGAYETLWSEPGTTFKSLSERFARHPGSVPSDFVSETDALDCAAVVKRRFEEAHVEGFGVRVHGAGEYPDKLRDAAHPIKLFYYQGWWDLAYTRSVAVVGTRKPSRDGLSRTRRLVRSLVADNFTVVSGLAAGIDRFAHETAIDMGGRTIAVIGTPLSHAYPKENGNLQRYIAEHFLLISQVPLRRYESQDYRHNRGFFPERNITMSALTEATVIIEAGETSGTLIQARAALGQGRKLFILDSCFRDPHLTWPARLAEKGAIRVEDYDDVRRWLCS
ncbi:MAG: DNA-protecting protein DprA [Paracoccaceae bacterium]|nr:DNA-protecting protein DprA [Paracoccaceae bacterium]MDE2912551.1 DNA-protecting protein DprA [Paracoccaceae bacterium]